MAGYLASINKNQRRLFDSSGLDDSPVTDGMVSDLPYFWSLLPVPDSKPIFFDG